MFDRRPTDVLRTSHHLVPWSSHNCVPDVIIFREPSGDVPRVLCVGWVFPMIIFLIVNAYHLKIIENHGSFIPLKYSLTDLTEHLRKIIPCFMIYEVTQVHYQETQIKKWTFLYFLKSVNFSNDSFTNSCLKYG